MIDLNNININNNENADSLNVNKIDWNDVDNIFNKYDISPMILKLLHITTDYRKEVNDTLKLYDSLKQSIDKFNKTISSQLEWIKSVPDGLDNDVIKNSIESMLQKYFDKNDVIELFKNYRKTYVKLMLMISFAPTEFIGKEKCAICLSANRNTVLVPCGHTCCNVCVQNINDCMVCRKKIEKKQRIYEWYSTNDKID